MMLEPLALRLCRLPCAMLLLLPAQQSPLPAHGRFCEEILRVLEGNLHGHAQPYSLIYLHEFLSGPDWLKVQVSEPI
jgi:hypothetical protein